MINNKHGVICKFKTILFLILLLFLNNSVYGQHLKFKGIPIDGNIEAFSKQLINKGYKIALNNKKAKKGTRIFDGDFFGESAQLYVKYDQKTYNVYCVMVAYQNTSYNFISNLKNKIEKVICEKYIQNHHKDQGKTGIPLIVYNIYNSQDDDDKLFLGQISLNENEESYADKTYFLCVGYTDRINYAKAQRSLNDDI